MSEPKIIKFACNGLNGKEGTYGGTDRSSLNGCVGGQGENGSNASNIELNIKSEMYQVIIIENNNNNKYSSILLGVDNISISLMAQGGSGGKGGQGGSGSRGRDGDNGQNATNLSNATNGMDGGNGSDGGNGGTGGDGGNGGNITIKINSSDMDLLMLIDQVNIKGGNSGLGGNGGNCGNGGKGGKGGSEYYEVDGKKHKRMPPGSDGKYGLSGANGKEGAKGEQGKDGQYTIIVDGQRYNSRYNLIVENVGQISDDNIIEPGEELEIKDITFKNDGGMNTPSQQRIGISLQNSENLYFNSADTVFISKVINSGVSYQLETPLKCKINDYIGPAKDVAYKQQVILKYVATVERVNKLFDQVSSKPTTYEICFPVEISEIQLAKSIKLNEEAPIAFSIWNRSTKPIGFETNSKRLLTYRIIQKGSDQVVQFEPKQSYDEDRLRRNSLKEAILSSSQSNFINPNAEDDKNIIIESEFITNLMPNEKKVISGTIKFKNCDIPHNSLINLQVKLDLGYVHDQSAKYQNIFSKDLSIQLSHQYEYNPNSQFLLISNQETSNSLIDEFKQFAYSFGSSIDIWNISNYQGFSYDYLAANGKSIKELYKNKVIIMLCNVQYLQNGIATCAQFQIGENNIYNASKFHSIKQYIKIGDYDQLLYYNIKDIKEFEKQVNSEQEIYKRFNRDYEFKKNLGSEQRNEMYHIDKQQREQAYSFNYSEKKSCCSTEPYLRIHYKRNEILNKVNKANNKYMHSVLIGRYYHEFQEQSDLGSNMQMIGNYQVIEMLRKDKAQIILSCYQFNNLFDYDKFSLIKLLSFSKKLNFFTRSLSNFENIQIVIDCIFSDLADEFIAFRDSDIKKKQVPQHMKRWKKFSKFDFSSQLSNQKQNNGALYTAENETNNLVQPQIVDLERKAKILEYLYSRIYCFKLVLSKYKECFLSSLCSGGGSNSVVSYCSQLLSEVVQQLFVDKNEIDKQNGVQQNIPRNKVESQGIYEIQQPQKYQLQSVLISNSKSVLEKLSKQDLKFRQTTQSVMNKIQEDGTYMFIDEKTQLINQNKRITMIEKFEKQIVFKENKKL